MATWKRDLGAVAKEYYVERIQCVTKSIYNSREDEVFVIIGSFMFRL